MADGRVINGGERFGIWCDYKFKDYAKQLPSARWDADLKCWHVSRQFQKEAQDLINIINSGGEPGHKQSKQQPPPSGMEEAFHLVFKSVSPTVGAALYKSAVKALHPDTGGDLKAMQALTAAWSKIK